MIRHLQIPALLALLALLVLLLPAVARADGKLMRGEASYYGSARSPKLTAAHRVLPMGTRVEVINRSNGKRVIVVINDRGPFRKGRVIDLSYAAAKKLGMITSGVAPVQLVLARRKLPARPKRPVLRRAE